MDCLFCAIIKGEIPSGKIYEDEYCYCFKDINPQAKVHALVVPKVHITSVDAIDEQSSVIISKIFEAIPKIARLLSLKDGYRVVSNIGDHGCQSVKHLHFHILGGERLSDKMA
ncbi:MAG: histidine triad nucleotide-binding protein [Clostridia bacterium]|nr:histidine triad nucleotide-binding protein [Clostridia bacterium]